MSEVKVNKVTPRTGNTTQLGDSGDTITIPSGGTISVAGSITNTGTATGFKDIDWQSVVTADGSTSTTAEAGKGYFIDTSSAAHTINLPASPSTGDTVAIADYASTFGTNNVTVGRNSSNIQGVSSNATIETNSRAVTFVYIDSTKGWIPVNDNTTANYGKQYTAATGGTVTTSGDYKIHTFLSSGCFVVSTAGNTPSSPGEVSYLVVAGGGGTGSGLAGGGGAGGFRENRASGESYTVSPLNGSTPITVTAQTYPITVGGGGAANPVDGGDGSQGSNSVFSTITSAGGGFGAGYGPPGGTGGTGGSGGGAGGNATNTGGAGNTPPVSPSQGNPGGNGNGTNPGRAGGGGGGAGQAGNNSTSGSPYNFGNGGNGVHTEINPATGAPGTSPINPSPAGNNYYAGGGGGNGDQAANGATQSGRKGVGGGGDGREGGNTGTAGTANTGGGGGGGGSGSNNGSAGGSGIVIIRYKYQN